MQEAVKLAPRDAEMRFKLALAWNEVGDLKRAQAELEQLSYEYVRSNLTTTRTDATSLFVGGGAAWPLGSNVTAFATALYNVSYGSQSPSPYSGPWVFRFGVGVGF